jgi:curved DNA-binding protein CbpA
LKNYYEILELPNFATVEEVKKAFKRLAILYHPDKNIDDKNAEEKFKEINEAYQILSHATAKERYDTLLAVGYTQEELKNSYFTKNPTESQRRKEEQQAAWREYLKRKQAPKPHELTNIQAFLLAISFVVYMLVLVNNLVDFYARLQYLWAREAYEQKAYHVAMNHIERSIAADHRFGKAYKLAGQIQLQHLKKYVSAVENFTHALDYAEKPHHELVYWRGLAWSHLGEVKHAMQDFDFMLQQYPDSIQLKTQIADHVYYLLRNDVLSEKMFTELLRTDNKNYYFLINLGDIAFRKQSYEKAANFYTQLIGLYPNKIHPYKQRSFCYLELQNVPQACQDWQKVKQMDSTMRDQTLDFFCL